MPYIGNEVGNRFVASKSASVYSGNGSTTAFTLDIAPSSVFDIEVFVENVRTFDIEGIAQIIPSFLLLFWSFPSLCLT